MKEEEHNQKYLYLILLILEPKAYGTSTLPLDYQVPLYGCWVFRDVWKLHEPKLSKSKQARTELRFGSSKLVFTLLCASVHLWKFGCTGRTHWLYAENPETNDKWANCNLMSTVKIPCSLPSDGFYEYRQKMSVSGKIKNCNTFQLNQ